MKARATNFTAIRLKAQTSSGAKSNVGITQPSVRVRRYGVGPARPDSYASRAYDHVPPALGTSRDSPTSPSYPTRAHRTPGVSWRTALPRRFDYVDDRYGLAAEAHDDSGQHFTRVGYVRRHRLPTQSSGRPVSAQRPKRSTPSAS
jgi:hypothetical protein